MGNLNDAIAKINAEIEIVNKWMSRHGMKLNPSKTQAILNGANRRLGRNDSSSIPKLRVGELQINHNTSVKYLGYTFNKKIYS